MSDFLPKLKQLEHAAAIVYESMPPTPQYAWPLLRAQLGAEIWV
jgi:threonine dehydratase